MDKDYWHRKWKSKELGFNQLQPNKLMQSYFSCLKLKVGCRVFVPLCGQSVDMLWLAEQGYEVVGVELSQVACDDFFKENNISVKMIEIKDFILYTSQEITIFCGDFFKLNRTTLGQIDAVYDRAALIALPTDIRKSYTEHLIKLGKPAASIFLITTVYNQNEMQGPPFSIDEDEVSTLYSAYFEINQVYNKQFETPEHLKAKGLFQAREQAYILTKKSLINKDLINHDKST